MSSGHNIKFGANVQYKKEIDSTMFKIIIKTFFTVLIIAGIVFLAAYKSYEFGQELSNHTSGDMVAVK